MPSTTDLIEFCDAVKQLLDARQTPHARHADSPLSVAEQVEQSIKQLISTGEFPPGMRLLEIDLANRFGISRAPVRDALRMLDKQGFVEIVPRRGAMVYQPSPADITNLYEIRSQLLGLAARKAARAIDAEISDLSKTGVRLMTRMASDKATTADEYMMVRTQLSTLILIAADNPRLTHLIATMSLQATTHARVFESSEHRRRNARTWKSIFNAILAGDSQQAEKEARTLVLDSRDELLRQMRSTTE